MEKMKSINDIASFLEKRGQKIKPLNWDAIESIEDKFAVTLPLVYKEFLRLMGDGAGEYMKGSSVFFNELFLLEQWTTELILENNIPHLPPGSFVFWMHQGYQAAYFTLDDGDDPPVFLFSEGDDNDGFELVENSLTKFFLTQLESM